MAIEIGSDLDFDDDVLVFESSMDGVDLREAFSWTGALVSRAEEWSLGQEVSRRTRASQASKSDLPCRSSFNIYSACKAGDLDRVRELVEDQDVDINRPDDGIESVLKTLDLVKYLLDKGALLDASTFVGARCYYGALNDEIRGILKTYHANSKQVDELSQAMCRVIGCNPDTPFADFEFIVQNRPIRVHRFIVMKQCAYFKEIMSEGGKWYNRSQARFREDGKVTYQSFLSLIVFLYTDHLQIEIEQSNLDSLLYILDKIRMHSLRQAVINKIKLAKEKNIRQLILRPGKSSNHLKSLFLKLFRLCIARPLSAHPDFVLKYCDISIPCHRVILWSRAQFFKNLLAGPFEEKFIVLKNDLAGLDEEDELFLMPELELAGIKVPRRFRQDVFRGFVQYIYCGSTAFDHVATSLSNQNDDIFICDQADFWFHLLSFADLYLIEGLKLHCFRKLSQFTCLRNMWKMLSLGIQFQSARLIDAVVDVIRFDVRRVYVSSEFDLIQRNPENLPLFESFKQVLQEEHELVYEYMVQMYTERCKSSNNRMNC